MNEKQYLEDSAARYFIDAIYRNTGIKYSIISHQDRPDMVIKREDTGEVIGIEVTHLFYDSSEARIILGRSTEPVHTEETLEHYINRLNQLLQQKADKGRNYPGNLRTLLLVRVVSPVFNIDDFNSMSDKIVVPECIYKNIWLLFYDFDQHYWGILKLLK